MGYYIDLQKISLAQYKEMLASTDLIPSWMPLRDDLKETLHTLKKHGVQNLAELLEALKNKGKLQEFSAKSGLSEAYLALLKRMVSGYRPKPNRIKDFPGLDQDVVLTLEGLGIKNTFQLFDHLKTPEARQLFSGETEFDKDTVLRLTRLTDLSRIRWVNHTFAYVLLEAGYRSVEEVVDAHPQKLYETIKQLNSETNFYKAHIGLRDMKRCIEAAQRVPLDIQY